MKKGILLYAAINIFIVMPIYFFNPQFIGLIKTTIATSTLFFITWLIIYQVIKFGLIRKMDGISLALGAVIGLKFFFTLAIFLLLYFTNTFQTKFDIGLFLLIYLIYTFFIGFEGAKMLDKKS